jgi:TRAP-type C4-dicarboxylate transport system substrate-binding protein
MNFKMSKWVACAIALSVSPAVADVTWDFASPYPGFSYHGVNAERFIREVSDATGGAVTINHHPGASLYAAPEIKRAVQTEQIAIGELLVSAMENDAAIFGIDSIPFLATDFDSAYLLWLASRELTEAKLAEQGLTLLYGVSWPGQGLYTRREINSVSDLRGGKMRIQNPATAAMAEMFGAQATTVESADLAQGMETGVIDMFITSASTGSDMVAWDYSTHFYNLNAYVPKNVTYINTKLLQSLPQEQQESIMIAAAAAEARGWAMMEVEIREKQANLCEGLQCAEVSETLLSELEEIGSVLTERWLTLAGEEGAEVIARYRALVDAM